MFRTSESKAAVVNSQRRKLLQGAGAVAAAGIASPVLGSVCNGHSSIAVSGTVVSKIGAPVKLMTLRNHSNQTLVLSKFSNGALMFDGEVVDCNGACFDKPITLAAGEETTIRFDKRKLFGSTLQSDKTVNVLSKVQRLHDGTRVIPFDGVIENGIATLDATPDMLVA